MYIFREGPVFELPADPSVSTSSAIEAQLADIVGVISWLSIFLVFCCG